MAYVPTFRFPMVRKVPTDCPKKIKRQLAIDTATFTALA